MCNHKYKDGKSAIIIIYTNEKSNSDGKLYKIRDYAFCEKCGKIFTVSP